MLPSCEPKDNTYQTHDHRQVHTGKTDSLFTRENQLVNDVIQIDLILPTYHDDTRFVERWFPADLIVFNQLPKQQNDKQQEYLVHAYRDEFQVALIALVVIETISIGLFES